ncbi:MAG: type II toxin-antitoxin system RelE/ParE family toxin [Halieaceae bacterium]
MGWNLEYTNEFGDWWETLKEQEQDNVVATAELLMKLGPNLPFPYSSGVHGSKHRHMRELRIQSGGRPLRIFYAFDPRRQAILLIGGDKTGNKRFYERTVPLADRLYEQHLQELKDEGLIQ